LARLHRPGHAAGDDGEAQPPELGGDRARPARRPGCPAACAPSEDRHAAVDAAQRVEAHADLGPHACDALLVGDEARDARHLRAEELLVVGGGDPRIRLGGAHRTVTVSRPASSGGCIAVM